MITKETCMDEIRRSCRCGQAVMVARGPPITASECHCTSCAIAADRLDPAPLPTDIPNPKSRGVGFMVRLLGVWVAMGLRTPKVAVGHERLVSDD
jgi:hypothetical protein